MPTYEYECKACKRRSDVIQRMSDPPIGRCPHCGSPTVSRCISAPTVLTRADNSSVSQLLPQRQDRLVADFAMEPDFRHPRFGGYMLGVRPNGHQG